MKNLCVLGDKLRVRREECGLTIEDVYRKAHIPPKIVLALESGNLGALPSGCYTAGFIKTYCALLEIPPECYLVNYQAPVQTSLRTLWRHKEPHGAAAPPQWLGNVVAWAAVCGFVALGWLTYAVVVRPQADNQKLRVQAETHEAPAPIEHDGFEQ